METHQSWCSKMCNSILGVFVGIFIVLCALVGIWLNESNAVCTQKAYNDAKSSTTESNCAFSSSNQNKFVHISCKVDPGLAVRDPGTSLTVPNAYEMTTTTEMYQYKQTSQSRSKKDSVGGGTSTTTCYCWQGGWYSTYQSIDMDKVNNRKYWCSGCTTAPRTNNPVLSGSTSTTGLGSRTATSSTGVSLGSKKFKVDSTQIQKISGGTVNKIRSGSVGNSKWKWKDDYLCLTNTCSGNQGDTRIQIKTRTSTQLSAVGKQVGSTAPGTLSTEEFGGSAFPPCSHRDVLYIADGSKTSETLYKELASSLSALTWILRFITYLALWFGLVLITGPLSVAPDLIPCCGPMIGDLVGCMLGLFAMLVAACMWLSTTSLAYIVYHPVLGIGMLAFAVAFAVGAYFLRKRSMGSKAGMGSPFISPQTGDGYGYPQQGSYQPPVAKAYNPQQGYPQQQQGYGYPQ